MTTPRHYMVGDRVLITSGFQAAKSGKIVEHVGHESFRVRLFDAEDMTVTVLRSQIATLSEAASAVRNRRERATHD